MTKEVIELQEGKILRGMYAKDEIINLFKNFQTNSTVISKLIIDKYNYWFESNKDEYTIQLTNVDVDTYSTYISKYNIQIDNDLLKNNIKKEMMK